jgi:hypothetical protein
MNSGVGIIKAIAMPFRDYSQTVPYQRNRRLPRIVGLVSKATSEARSVGNKTTRRAKQRRNSLFPT